MYVQVKQFIVHLKLMQHYKLYFKIKEKKLSQLSCLNMPLYTFNYCKTWYMH